MGFILRMSARVFRVVWLVALLVSVFSTRGAEDIETTRRLLITGRYELVIANAEKALAARERDDEWRTVLMRAQLAMGKYPEAMGAATNALRRYSSSIRLKLAIYDVLKANGEHEAAAALVEDLNELLTARYR